MDFRRFGFGIKQLIHYMETSVSRTGQRKITQPIEIGNRVIWFNSIVGN